MTAFVALGSNMGDKAANLRRALLAVDALPGVQVCRAAGLYQTDPVGYTEQDWFLNSVAEVTATLEPENLLAELLAIEDRLGRVRLMRWGPRIVDLDLLLYGQVHRNTADLILPHPRMLERAFVMVPLAELVPDMLLAGETVRQRADRLAMEQKVIYTGQRIW